MRQAEDGTVIDLSYSNRSEPLLDALAENVAATQATLYDPVYLIVPNGHVEGYLKQGLARRRGIAAHVRTRFLRAFLREIAQASAPGLRVVDREAIEGELLALFHDPRRLALAELAPVRSYLEPDDGDRHALDRRRAQLAAQLADLFDEYSYSRPDMLAAWRKGALIAGWDEPMQRWQRELWLALFGRGGTLAGDATAALPDFFERTPAHDLKVPGAAAHVFGISFVARLYRSIFASLARATSLFVYTLNPCRELWEDVQPARRASPKRRGSSRQLALALGDAPAATATPAADENPLLALWGRPGRDSIRIYNDLSDCNFRERFVDPAAGMAAPTLLATLQREVLERAPRSRDPAPLDDSLVMFGAPDPRRELETVAAEIWSLVRRDETLRFDDFAVVVPAASADTYLPLAREVFTAASDLPHDVLGLPSTAQGHVLEAAELLLALPSGALSRPELLQIATHPTVARRFPDVDPQDFGALCEQLGIVRGADGAALGETYADHDRFSWDQGLRRLALGAFLSGRRSGEEQPFSFDGHDEAVLPAELPAGGEPAARALGIIARELIEFARTARDLTAPLPDFMELLRRTFAAAIRPGSHEEEAALGDCFAALERIAEAAPPGLQVGFGIAAELVRARLGALQRRLRPAEGVAVAGFAPLRALSFRVVFMLGLDERVFPSAAGFGALDLRGAAPGPQPGDVTPREQDEYVFFETLLSARERLYLSHVNRDATTGERKDPSSTVLALADVLGRGARGDEVLRHITRPTPPLARHRDDAVCAVIPAAARERQAAALGRSLRQAAGRIQLPEATELRAALPAATWAALTPPLGHLALGPKRDTPRRAVTTLTLADLRRFLECPLQGSVRVLLPMRDDDDADDEAESALRERENLGDVRPRTLPLLRELFARAIDAGATEDPALAERYDAAIAGLRLDGTLPSGLFGSVVRVHHLGLLVSWRRGLRVALEDRLPGGLAPIWYGAAPEHRPDVRIDPPLAVSVPSPDGVRPITLLGQTEPLAIVDGTRLAITLVGNRHRDDSADRDRLRAWLTHLALSASGLAADQPLRSLVIAGEATGDAARVRAVDLAPLSAAEARATLSALAADLLSGVHPYLLPCEGVFSWRGRQGTERATSVREAVMSLRDDGWTILSSDRGPIPDARRYPVPADADARAAQRFGRFFAAMREPS
jgi:exodeoxyribonuclease V gamma subunit